MYVENIELSMLVYDLEMSKFDGKYFMAGKFRGKKV